MALQFKDIPQFPRAHYEIDCEWRYLEQLLKGYIDDYGLNLDPDFQRAHVWTKDQQRAYIEHCLMGGEVGRNLTFNATHWNKSDPSEGTFEIIDGKQRLEAVRAFLRDEVAVFGHKDNVYSAMGPKFLRLISANFKVRICSLETRKEVIEMYLKINAGGTPHTKKELDRVRKLLEDENGKATV